MPKHLVCGDSEPRAMTVDDIHIRADEDTLRRRNSPPPPAFRYAADAGCFWMLAAYNRVNGDYCAEQYHVMTEIVKGDWDYRGAIMSDWFGTHSTAPTLNAGLDLEMPGAVPLSRSEGGGGRGRGRRRAAIARRRCRRACSTGHREKNATGAKSPLPIPMPRRVAFSPRRRRLVSSCSGTRGDILPLDPRKPGPSRSSARMRCTPPVSRAAPLPRFRSGPIFPRPSRHLVRARYEKGRYRPVRPMSISAPRLPFMSVSPAQDLGDGCTADDDARIFRVALIAAARR
ncbi:hypothetical protein JD971_00035 [Croceicoccus sp. YJ47]|nr:hypothetical protein JD971_00035 [Croceicoccus sp. YJ47]